MRVAIFGSGYGLYGYLPALIDSCNAEVILQERYRGVLLGRADIGHFKRQIKWVEDETSALKSAEALVISQRPMDQVNLTETLGPFTNIKRVMLEKPLAPTPGQARLLSDAFISSDKKFRIGYLFRHLPWAGRLASAVHGTEAQGAISIRWTFRANHYSKNTFNWKRLSVEGGGALRFYGIHLIALLAEFGYNRVLSSLVEASLPSEAETWRCDFNGPGLPICSVYINTNASEQTFSVKTSSMTLVAQASPFDEALQHKGQDIRISVIAQACNDLLGESLCPLPWYDEVIELWDAVERVTVLRRSPRFYLGNDSAT